MLREKKTKEKGKQKEGQEEEKSNQELYQLKNSCLKDLKFEKNKDSFFFWSTLQVKE